MVRQNALKIRSWQMFFGLESRVTTNSRSCQLRIDYLIEDE